MATLTWRNVDAPDFRSSLDGYRTAGQLLKNAAAGWNDQLAADSALATEAQQRDIRAEGLNQTQYINSRLRDDNANLDAAAPAMRALATGAFSNDREAVTDALGNPVLQKLNGPQYMQALGANQGLMGAALSQDGTRLNQDVTQYGFDRTKRNDGFAEQVAMVMPDIIRNSANQADLLKNSEAAMKDFSPEARGPFMRAVNAYAPGTYGLGAIAGTVEDVKGTGVSSTGSVPGKATAVPAANIAQAIYGQESNSGKADTSKVNSQGVTGPMQVQEATFEGMKKLGIIPSTYDHKNPEQNKDAGFKWVDYLSKKYDGDPAKVAAAYYGGEKAVKADGTINRDMKNLQRPGDPTVGEYVDQVVGRLGTGGAANSSTSMPSVGDRRDAAFQIQAKVGDIANTGITADIEKAQVSTKSLSEVADELIGTDVKDWSVKRTMSELQKIMTAGKVTAPVAAAVLRRSLSAPNSDGNTIFSKYLPWVDSQKNVDENLVMANIAAISGGGIDRAVSTLGETKDFAESLSSAESKAQAAKAELQAIQARVDAGQTGLKDSLPALQNKRDEAVMKLNKLLDQQRNNINLNADRAAQKAAKDLLELQQKQKVSQASTPVAKKGSKPLSPEEIQQIIAAAAF